MWTDVRGQSPDDRIRSLPEAIRVHPKFRPALDPEFVPVSLWNRAYRAAVHDLCGGDPLAIALQLMANVQVHNRMPTPDESAQVAGVFVLRALPASPGFEPTAVPGDRHERRAGAFGETAPQETRRQAAAEREAGPRRAGHH